MLSSFGVASDDIQNTIADWQGKIIDLESQLDQATSGFFTSSTMRNNFVAWDANAQYFIELSDRAANDADTFNAWKTAGRNILQHGQELANLIGDSTITSVVGHYLATFPSSLAYVATETLSAAGTAVGSGISSLTSMLPWWVPALGALALVAYMWPKTGSKSTPKSS
jgi:hypothetical protein